MFNLFFVDDYRWAVKIK